MSTKRENLLAFDAGKGLGRNGEAQALERLLREAISGKGDYQESLALLAGYVCGMEKLRNEREEGRFKSEMLLASGDTLSAIDADDDA